MTPDIKIHIIAFDGRVFEPVTPVGVNWCHNIVGSNDNSLFYTNNDACMTGFSNDAFGVEARYFETFALNMFDSDVVGVLA